jgi:hypothetical protein
MHVGNFHFVEQFIQSPVFIINDNVWESDPSQSWSDRLKAQILHTCDYLLLDLKFSQEFFREVMAI